MEFAAMGLGVGQVAAVAQLVGNVGGLIWKIKQAADTAKQNKRECDNLVSYLSIIEEVLPTLPQDPEVVRPLQKLVTKLQEEHDLVVGCQKRASFNKLFRASDDEDCFKEVKARIAADLALFPLVTYSAIARCLDRMISPLPLAQHDSGIRGPSISSSSGSMAVQTQTVVSHTRRLLTWAEIAAATNNLADVLGDGRSGTVYKGHLHHRGRVRAVAVKVLKHGRQGKEVSFIAENEILFHISHDHIAGLVGSCAAEERRILVYEHMSNGSLRDHLHGAHGGESPVASSWKARFEVLLGTARALRHLHRHPKWPVIHRNVSSSNILLDVNWTSRLSDFGQSLLKQAGEEGQLVQEAIGTFGYLDPEYYRTSRVSPASDVYSFGVVTLEVLTGRPHVSSSKGRSAEVPVTLVSSVLPVIKAGRLQDVLDGRPALPTPRQLEALELVAHTVELCLWKHGKDRPAMSNVVDNLEGALRMIRSDEG